MKAIYKKAGSGTTGAALGSIVGGGLSAFRQHRKNKRNPNEKKSLLGAATKGGAAGGLIGGGVGLAKGKLDGIKKEIRDKHEPILQRKLKKINDKHNDLMDSIKKSNEALKKVSALQGKTLNKPIKTPNGPKKSKVYVKNDKGNVVMVRFGDPNMSIKKDDPARRKSFRARHNCDNPGPKWKARYWSCKAW